MAVAADQVTDEDLYRQKHFLATQQVDEARHAG